MAIPDYQSIMLPLLTFAGDNQEHSLRQAIESLAVLFQLSDEERHILLPSGRQSTFDNRVGWASTYLKKAKLLESTRRGHFKISKRGVDVLKTDPSKIDNNYLKQYSEFIEFQASKQTTGKTVTKPELTDEVTPEEAIEDAYQRLREELADDLLETIKSCSPEFFERLVVDLLVKMGYGGTRQDAGQAIGKSGDGGIDGIIKEDRLGLDTVYIQAKRWEGSVGRPEIQKFAGALQGHRAKKGVFLTTSTFSASALDYVTRIDSKIVLINGELLAQFMIDYDLGVSQIAAYAIKQLDSDYFP